MTTTRRPRTAAGRWQAMIAKEHAQSERVRGETPSDDWQGFARRFRPDPEAGENDPQLQAIARLIQPHHTVLDVGAGGGRLAIPLARRCKEVIAVEPAGSMGAVLTDAAKQAGVGNVRLVASTWEDAEVPAADVVICAHVLYTVQDILPFVRKLEAHARERVIVVLFVQPAHAHLAPFWRRIYGDDRLQLPALPEFMRVLWETGVYPDLTMLPARRSGRYATLDEAWDTLRARLYVRRGTPEDARLTAATDLLEEAEGAWWVRRAPSQRAGIVTWTPEKGGR